MKVVPPWPKAVHIRRGTSHSLVVKLRLGYLPYHEGHDQGHDPLQKAHLRKFFIFHEKHFFNEFESIPSLLLAKHIDRYRSEATTIGS
jgi:hypothetical protein